MNIFGRSSAARTSTQATRTTSSQSTNRPAARLAALRSGTALAAVAVVLGAAPHALAADQYWDGPSTLPVIIEGGGGIWSTGGTNWTDIGGGINGAWAGGTAVFGGTGGGVQVQGHQNFDTLRFTGNGYRLTATASDSLTLAPVGGTATINVGSGITAEIGMIVKGSAALDIVGGGILKLSDWANTYTGATTIGSGTTLQLIRQSKISASSGVTVDGTFDISTTDAGASIKALSGSGQVILGERSLFLTDANGTFSGVISGNGGLNISGTKQIFTGANTYLGSTGVSDGATLQIGDGGTTGSVAGAINNLGTLVFNRSDDLTVAGQINSAGSFQHVGGGKLTLTGTGNSGSGTATVLISNNSTLQFGDGGVSGWLGGTDGKITIDAGSKLISNMSNGLGYLPQNVKLAGAGQFFKQGSGTITLRGDSSAFAGETFVNAGMLNVGYKGLGTLAGPVSVDSGARFGGSGTVVGNVTIASGAAHAVGDKANPATTGLVHTQTVNGNYVNHGILEIEATPETADKLTVNGTVNISGATLNLSLTPNDPSPAGGWDPLNGPFTIIANDGGDAVTGTFASVGNLNNLLFLNHLISYTGGDGNDVTLALSRNDLSVEEVAQSPNQSAVAGAVDGLPSGNPVRSALLMSTDEDEARDALEQLAGDVHASVSGGTTQTSQFLGEFANDRVRSAFGDVAAPDLPVMGYGEGGLELVAADSDRFVVWGQALGNWGSFDGDGNSGGFEHASGGLVAGGDTIVGDGWRVGLLGGYSRTSFDADDGAASGDSDNFHVGVYGGRHFGAVALRAGASYTRHAIDTSRTVSFPGLTETLKASYDAGTAQAFIEAGYRAEMGRVAFEPFAGLAYVSTSTDGFTETGGAAALTSADKSFDSTTTTLGLRAASDFNVGDGKATVRGGLGWRHAFGDVTPASTVAFVGGGDSFTVYGAPIARDALLIEAGLDFAIAPKANLGLSYTGQVANGARDHGVKASLGVKF
ncbi:outer membrane autotransporter protein [Aminobacter aminovorans]|uniref:Extracellular serine protease n=1 Tax=Aminobacter aminovorans TaxID=83263 RepID=A0A380WGC0_AMIAI|nr:outer membrane autotransporter protein [Aminobacter aminovorans]SUU88047.1 Extracellular serine protease precursor [Aminobacter aminovorans]